MSLWFLGKSKGGSRTLYAVTVPAAVVVCLVVALVLALGSWAGTNSGDSAAPAAKEKAPPADGTFSVTIDGREATPVEREAFRAFFSHAFTEAIYKSYQEALQKLDITEPMEKELLGVSFGPDQPSGNGTMSIWLIRPGKNIEAPRTTVLGNDDRLVFRFTRVVAPVERPLAIMTFTGTKDGRPTRAERFLVYGTDGKWKPYRPSERTVTLKDGPE
jgi:hypothetical protein